MATYIIDTTLRSRGTDHHVYYYHDGYGSTYERNVISLELHTISSSGSSASIGYEEDLCKAVANLPDGGELAVIAVKDNTVDPELGPDQIGPYPEDFARCPDCYDDLSRSDRGILKIRKNGCSP